MFFSDFLGTNLQDGLNYNNDTTAEDFRQGIEIQVHYYKKIKNKWVLDLNKLTPISKLGYKNKTQTPRQIKIQAMAYHYLRYTSAYSDIDKKITILEDW